MENKIIKARVKSHLHADLENALKRINDKFVAECKDERSESELIREALKIGIKNIIFRLDKGIY